MVKKEFVEFYFPGVSVSGRNEREVVSRNEINIPRNAVSYRFFNKDEDGNNINYSSYYFVGTEYSIEEFGKKYPQLKDDPELAKAKRIVKVRTGSFYALSGTDIVVTA